MKNPTTFANVTFSAFCDAFYDHGRENQFSYDAKRVIYDYFHDLEEEGVDVFELDVICICCGYSEDSPIGIAKSYNLDISDIAEDEVFDFVSDWLNDRTTVLGSTDRDGYIVYCSDF